MTSIRNSFMEFVNIAKEKVLNIKNKKAEISLSRDSH